MRKYIIILLLNLLPWLSLFSQPKNEIRAVWLTTVYGLDWPQTKANNRTEIKKQQDELCKMLDTLKDANFNTVLFQVRMRGDVVYPSRIEPFGAIFTGKTGRDPGYNPLAFAIEECHKRGMELHAWLVAIPLGSAKQVKNLGAASVTRKQPAICKQYKNEWFLDPGHPGTKEYLYSIVREIITGYDVDGIHLDYIRYPDRPAGFPDSDSFRKYGKGKFLSDWRRENISAIVRRVYHGVKEIKPWVKVSSSPLGKFRDTSRYSSSGWNAYNTVYQDAQGWLREGIQDLLFPMMYFTGNQFYPFALDWKEKNFGRPIVPGLGIYFLHPSEKNWALDVIERQIYFTRNHGLAGQAHYRARFVTDNTKGLLNELICNYYPYPALQPAMSWLDNSAPSIPQQPELEEKRGDIFLKWQPSTDNDPRISPFYTIYASDNYPVDISLATNIIATRIRGNQFIYSPVYPKQKKKYFAVTASDRYGNESEPMQFSHPKDTPVVFNDEKSLCLPPQSQATYITITDITGRSVLNTLYSTDVSIEKLDKGCYRVLVTDKADNVTYQGYIRK